MLHIDSTYSNYIDFLVINSGSSEDAKKFVWTKDECEKIIALGNVLPEQQGALFSEKIDLSMRKVSKFLIENNTEFAWIYDRIARTVLNANTFFWNYDIDFIETVELLRYTHDPNQEVQDHYNKHSDFGPKINKRKLSYSATLSDPTKYKGGDLTMYLENDIILPKEQGQVVIFPSFQLHSVSSMQQGTRWSLVTWVSGRPFR